MPGLTPTDVVTGTRTPTDVVTDARTPTDVREVTGASAAGASRTAQDSRAAGASRTTPASRATGDSRAAPDAGTANESRADARTAGPGRTGARAASGPRAADPGAAPGRPTPDRAAAQPPTPGRLGGPGLGVPAFAHPLVAPGEWAELARPGTPLHWTAFDVARGPGARPDPLYAQALERVRENAVPVLGQLDLAYGARPYAELMADASRYLGWYHVDGFYLGRTPTLESETAACLRLTGTLRTLLAQEHAHEAGAGPAAAGPEPVRIVMAPGAYPHPVYADIADQLVVFDGPWTRYRWSEAPQWSASYPAARFAHLVHGLPATHLDAALRIARWQGAGTLCMTDRTERGGGEDLPGAEAWAGLPTYWTDLVRLLREESGGTPNM